MCSTCDTASTVSAMAAEAPPVPTRMIVTETMKKSAEWLPTSKLIPLDFSPSIGDLIREATEGLTGKAALDQNAGPDGSICFVVRRPG
jgi:hypothetical protein